MILNYEFIPTVHAMHRGGETVIRCPFCNQVMEDETPEDAFTDLFRCGACQAQQAIYWEHGERLLTFESEPEN